MFNEKPWPLAFLAMLGMCLLLCQCGGDEGGSGPTAPASFILTFGGQIANATGRTTLREIELLLDGRVIGRTSSDSNAFTLIWLEVESVGRGQHEFGVRVVQQTSSPTRYLVGGGVDGVDPNGGSVLDENFTRQDRVLSTGDVVTWRFSF